MSNSVDIKKTFNVDPSSLPAKLPKSEKDPMRIAAFWTQKNINTDPNKTAGYGVRQQAYGPLVDALLDSGIYPFVSKKQASNAVTAYFTNERHMSGQYPLTNRECQMLSNNKILNNFDLTKDLGHPKFRTESDVSHLINHIDKDAVATDFQKRGLETSQIVKTVNAARANVSCKKTQNALKTLGLLSS